MLSGQKEFHWRATGACTKEGCGERTRAKLGNQEDARLFVNHYHGHAYGHCFEGEIKVVKVHTQEKLRKVA